MPKKVRRATASEMTTLEKSQRAQNYYDLYKSKSLFSGFEKFVATDGITEMFVNSDYEPENAEIMVFKLDTRHMQTGCQLYKPRCQKTDGSKSA